MAKSPAVSRLIRERTARLEKMKARDDLAAGLERARQFRALRDSEIEALLAAETTHASRLAEFYTKGGEKPVYNPAQDRRKLEGEKYESERAIELLDDQLAAAEKELECALATEVDAINTVRDEDDAKALDEARACLANLTALLPRLRIAQNRRADIADLNQFLASLPQTIESVQYSGAAGYKLANAIDRAWKLALADDPQAQRSEEAGRKLLETEAAAEAERRKREAAEDEKFRAEQQRLREEEGARARAANEAYFASKPAPTRALDPCAETIRQNSAAGLIN